MTYKVIKMGNYDLTVNNNNEVIEIMQQQPYKKLYPYRFDKQLGNMVQQENVKLSTLRTGLKKGNWGLY